MEGSTTQCDNGGSGIGEKGLPQPNLSFAVSMPVAYVQNLLVTASAHPMARLANAFASLTKSVVAG